MIEDIKKAIEVLRAGGIILYPTDTVWGIGCDATNEEAVQKIFNLKKREDKKAMLVLIDNAVKLQTYLNEVPDMAWDLIEFAEKPLTIIYPDARNLATSLLGADNSIGIRVTKEAFSKRLCEQFRKPIVSTSANFSGKQTALNFDEISDEIKAGVDYVVSFRQKEFTKPKPSSIIKMGKGNLFQLIRE